MYKAFSEVLASRLGNALGVRGPSMYVSWFCNDLWLRLACWPPWQPPPPFSSHFEGPCMLTTMAALLSLFIPVQGWTTWRYQGGRYGMLHEVLKQVLVSSPAALHFILPSSSALGPFLAKCLLMRSWPSASAFRAALHVVFLWRQLCSYCYKFVQAFFNLPCIGLVRLNVSCRGFVELRLARFHVSC